jgi:hypothetical protein
MKVEYFEGWHRHYAEAIGALTESEARSRDASGEPYVVVVGDRASPSCFIEVNRALRFFGISFLDRRKHEYLLYTFEQIEPDRLFLKEAIYREYDDDTPRVKSGTVYRFQTDGRMMIESSSGTFRRSEVREARVDVTPNWETVPSFGSYEGLVKRERELASSERRMGSEL